MRRICIRGAAPEAYAKGGARGACRSQRARRWRAAPRGARWEREDGGRRLPHRQAALPGRPAALEAPGGAHQGRGARQPLLPPVYLRSPRAALPLGGDAGQDAHHGLPGRRHQAAERGGGGGAGGRAAGRGHRLRGGRAVHLPGILPPEQQRQEEGGGAELHLAGPAGAGDRAQLDSGGPGRPAARDEPGAGGGRRRPAQEVAASGPRGAPRRDLDPGRRGKVRIGGAEMQVPTEGPGLFLECKYWIN